MLELKSGKRGWRAKICDILRTTKSNAIALRKQRRCDEHRSDHTFFKLILLIRGDSRVYPLGFGLNNTNTRICANIKICLERSCRSGAHLTSAVMQCYRIAFQIAEKKIMQRESLLLPRDRLLRA